MTHPCVQCGKEMAYARLFNKYKYENFSEVTFAYTCLTPECPRYKLLTIE